MTHFEMFLVVVNVLLVGNFLAFSSAAPDPEESDLCNETSLSLLPE